MYPEHILDAQHFHNSPELVSDSTFSLYYYAPSTAIPFSPQSSVILIAATSPMIIKCSLNSRVNCQINYQIVYN